MSLNFKEERQKLMEQISQNMDQLVSSLGEMNRNFETINDIGKEFQAPANVWHQFHTSVMKRDTAKSTLQPVIADTWKRQREEEEDEREFDMLFDRAITHKHARPITHRQHSQDQDHDMLSNQAVIQDDSHSITHHHHHHSQQHHNDDTLSNPTLPHDDSRSFTHHHSQQQQPK